MNTRDAHTIKIKNTRKYKQTSAGSGKWNKTDSLERIGRTRTAFKYRACDRERVRYKGDG